VALEAQPDFQANQVVRGPTASTDVGVVFASAVTGLQTRFVSSVCLIWQAWFSGRNVNQLFDPGLTFDRASGDFSLRQGDVDINEFAIRNGGGKLTLGGAY
jgi:hypothetical protein